MEYNAENSEKYQQVLKNILKDLPKRCSICPKDFNPQAPLKEIIEKYCKGNRYGKFTIKNFEIVPKENSLVELTQDEAILDVEDVAFLSGSGYSLVYKIKENNSVEFDRNENARIH